MAQGKTELSMGEFLRARRMQARGMDPGDVARRLGKGNSVSKSQVSRALANRRSVKPATAADDGQSGFKAAGLHGPWAISIPAETLSERERAFSAFQTLTASICGDPRPGRSALDQRKGT